MKTTKGPANKYAHISDLELQRLLMLACDAYEDLRLLDALALLDPYKDRDVPDVLVLLGQVYEAGDEVITHNTDLAKHFLGKYLKCIEVLLGEGDWGAGLCLGKELQYGHVTPKNERRAVEVFKRCAEGGNPEAMFHLANLYNYGWCGLEPNPCEYQRWLDKAVDGGHPEATYQMACLLLREEDVSQRDIALILIKKSADLGFWPAQDYLSNQSH